MLKSAGLYLRANHRGGLGNRKSRKGGRWDQATGQCESTLHISSPDFLEFDKVNVNHVHTTIGTFNIGSTYPVKSLIARSSCHNIMGKAWMMTQSLITYDATNLLWLPAEYRPAQPSLFAISAATLAIGCSSGRVLYLKLSEYNPIPGC